MACSRRNSGLGVGSPRLCQQDSPTDQMEEIEDDVVLRMLLAYKMEKQAEKDKQSEATGLVQSM